MLTLGVPQAVLGLGSNLGARRALFSCARELLLGDARLSLEKSSSLYHTPPLGPPQPDYLNAALLVSFRGDARELLSHCQRVEQLLLRQRRERWGARTLDIDILHWSDGPVCEPGLTIPHPGLTQRAFALAPLLDVLPELTSTFGPQLAALGGAPPISEEFGVPAVRTPSAARSRRELLTWPCLELAELVSAFGTALCASAPSEGRASAVRRFVSPAGPLELALATIEQAVRDALASGFAACQLAITDVSEGTLAGIMIGSETGRALRLPALGFRLESDPSGQRVRVWWTEPSALWP